MKNQTIKKTIVYILGAVTLFGGGFIYGLRGNDQFVHQSGEKIIVSNKNTQVKNVDFNLFWTAWDEVTKRYLYAKNINPQDMLYGAIKGMVASLGDPYTAFFDPEDLEQEKKSLASQYEGIGVELGFNNNQIVVVTPFAGSPAEKAGIRAGDYIVRVGDKTIEGLNLSEVASLIRGQQNTTVEVVVLHKDEITPVNLTITRSLITYETVTVEFDNDVAYVRVLQFGDSTNDEWDKVVERIETLGIRKIILDLRNNPGGYVMSSVYIAGDFVGNTVIVKEKYPDGSIESIKATNSKSRLENCQVITLINEGTASASEILAGALSYYNKSTLVGRKTFGKGIVQSIIPLPDNTSLNVTTYEWLTPGSKNIHKQGIDPTIEVEITEAQIKEGIDPQLDRAKQIFNQ